MLKGHGNEPVFTMFLRGVDDSPSDTESFLLKNSIADSPYRWCGESPTSCISDARSWRLRVSLMRGVGDSPYYWYAESATPRIGDSGESFFEWNISANSKPKIGGSVRDSWGTNYCKNPKKSASLPCPLKGNKYNISRIYTVRKIWIPLIQCW